MDTEQEDRIVTRITDAVTAKIIAALAGNRPSGGQPAAPATSGGGLRLPNYGRRKGEAIEGCPVSDLDYYASGCRRTLDDPSKSRWHDKERVLLAAIEAEIDRQSGANRSAVTGSGSDAPAFPSPDDGLPF